MPYAAGPNGFGPYGPTGPDRNLKFYMSPRYVTEIIYTKFQLSTYPSFHSSRGGWSDPPPRCVTGSKKPGSIRVKLLSSYLTGRAQFTKIDNFISVLAYILSGGPSRQRLRSPFVPNIYKRLA